MLQLTNRALVTPSGQEENAAYDASARILAIVRRRYPSVLSVFALIFSFAIVYLIATPSRYTAIASMVIDSSKLNLFQQQTIMNDAAVDSNAVETQAQILRSDNIALSVIRDLHLTSDPEFVERGGGFAASITNAVGSLFGAPRNPPEKENIETALRAFRKMERVTREGLTYVIDISFTSLNADRAAQIANAIADAYATDQMDAKFQATKRAGAWLQGRVAEIRDQAQAADMAVQNFKERNNIVDTDGRLMSEQELAEVNSQLIIARAQTAEAKARLDRIQEIVHADGATPEAGVADMLHSDVISKLRSEYLHLSEQASLWASKYGKGHLAVLNLHNQMDEIRHSILNELGRISGTYQSDYQIALAREQSLESSLEKTIAHSQNTKQAGVELKELQSNAQTYRTLYDNFLQRYMDAIQQQSFPISEARIISPAAPPLRRSQPNTSITLGLALLASLMIGAVAAMAREASDRVFRTTTQVEQILSTSCIAMLPALSAETETRGDQRPLKHTTPSLKKLIQRSLPNCGLMAYVVDHPHSRFAESLRAVKMAIDLACVSVRPADDGPVATGKVIAFTSTLPREGKGTVATNFARLMAQSGLRVVLIDGDLRHPDLSAKLSPDAKIGLLEVLNKSASLQEAIYTDQLTAMQFLPVSSRQNVGRSSEVLAAPSTKALIRSLQQECDLVIVDLPPLAPIVDARATTGFVDHYVYVVEWGRTNIDVVVHHLSRAANVRDRLLGVVLNKANTKKLGRYEYYYGDDYYNRQYSKYGDTT